MALNRHKKTYACYKSMLQRCYNPKSQRYYTHGGRSIKVCNRWKESYENFLEDMGQKPDGYSIERIDNNGDYSPKNCKWATAQEQARNRRTNIFIQYQGKEINLHALAKILGISGGCLKKRLSRMPIDKALSKTKYDRSSISLEIKTEILQRHFLGESGGKLAKEYGISQACVSKWRTKMAKKVDFII